MEGPGLQNELGQPPNRAQSPRPDRIGLDFRSKTGFWTFKSVRPLREKSGMRKHAHAEPPGGAMHCGSREVDKGTIPGLGRALFRVLWENHFFGGSGLKLQNTLCQRPGPPTTPGGLRVRKANGLRTPAKPMVGIAS